MPEGGQLKARPEHNTEEVVVTPLSTMQRCAPIGNSPSEITTGASSPMPFFPLFNLGVPPGPAKTITAADMQQQQRA